MLQLLKGEQSIVHIQEDSASPDRSENLSRRVDALDSSTGYNSNRTGGGSDGRDDEGEVLFPASHADTKQHVNAEQ